MKVKTPEPEETRRANQNHFLIGTQDGEGCRFCGGPVRSLRMCASHYYKYNTYGDALAKRKRRPAPAIEFIEMALEYEGDECLLFPFNRSKDGYARAEIGGKFVYVSRFICEEYRGSPPTPKHQAAHNCGQGRQGCITKRHLVWKTSAENIADKRLHGTALIGSRHHQAKLDEERVREIRRLRGCMKLPDIAALYGVSRSTISDILYGKTWLHVQH